MAKLPVGKASKGERKLGELGARRPVFYNKGGRQVKANGTRFSPKGCVVYTKSPHKSGTSFSLKITNSQSDRFIRVDSSVIMRKRLANEKEWAMMVRFMNLTADERDEIRQILADATAVSKKVVGSRYLKTPVGQTILRYFSFKKLIG